MSLHWTEWVWGDLYGSVYYPKLISSVASTHVKVSRMLWQQFNISLFTSSSTICFSYVQLMGLEGHEGVNDDSIFTSEGKHSCKGRLERKTMPWNHVNYKERLLLTISRHAESIKRLLEDWLWMVKAFLGWVKVSSMSAVTIRDSWCPLRVSLGC